MKGARPFIPFFFLQIVVILNTPAECAKPIDPKQIQLEKEISEVRKEVGQLKERLGDSVTLDLLKFFTPLLLVLLLGGGGAIWFAIHRGLMQSLSKEREGLSRDIKDQVNRLVEEPRRNLLDAIDEQAWVDGYRRENSIGGLWLELYEETTEHSPGIARYIEPAQRGFELALSYCDRLREDKHERIICIVKNNLAYCLAVKADPNHPAEKKRAFTLIDYVIERVSKYPDLAHRFLETYGWVLLKFAGDNREEKQKGRKVMDELFSRRDLPIDWYERRRTKYQRFLATQDP